MPPNVASAKNRQSDGVAPNTRPCTAAARTFSVETPADRSASTVIDWAIAGAAASGAPASVTPAQMTIATFMAT